MKHLNVRLPDDLHEIVVALAEGDRRSLNSEVIVLLIEAARARGVEIATA